MYYIVRTKSEFTAELSYLEISYEFYVAAIKAEKRKIFIET